MGVRIAGLAVKQLRFDVKGVGQAMGRVDAHDEGAVIRDGKVPDR